MREVYIETLRLRSEQVNLQRRLRTSALFRLLQEASIAHTEALGMGREKTLDRGKLWVVTLQYAAIDRLPVYDERVRLKTWPGETLHVLFPRYYAMETAEGEPLLRASALWTLVDAESRKLADPEDCGVVLPGIETGEELPLPSAPTPLPVTHSRPFTVPYSCVDLNGHMNNTRCFDLAEDLFPAAAAGRELREIRTEYQNEARFGEEMTLRWGEQGDRMYLSGAGAHPFFRMSLRYAP